MKKSMLMLVALFMLGACANHDEDFLAKVQNKEVAMTSGGDAAYYFSTDGKKVYDSSDDTLMGTFEEASDENTATYVKGTASTTTYTEDGKTGWMNGDLTSKNKVNVFLSTKKD